VAAEHTEPPAEQRHDAYDDEHSDKDWANDLQSLRLPQSDYRLGTADA
jgi:hypothetical protein